MRMKTMGSTGLSVAPLVLGGNVFGWTADRATSFALLDRFLDAGFNAIDTADVYCRVIPGKDGGESETILGEWMAERGVRDRIVLTTKAGMEMGEGMKGLSAAYLRQACEASLRRLKTDYIDLYLSHFPDPETPIEETLSEFQKLIDEGKIRHAGCSNYSAEQLQEALSAQGSGLARYEVVQPLYNLIQRDVYEGALEDLCVQENLGVTPFFALASGFLTGKYRSADDLKGARSGMVESHLNEHGLKLLAAMDQVAARHDASLAQIALAWLIARPSVTAPIASATSIEQLNDIMKSAEIALTPEDLDALNV